MGKFWWQKIAKMAAFPRFYFPKAIDIANTITTTVITTHGRNI